MTTRTDALGPGPCPKGPLGAKGEPGIPDPGRQEADVLVEYRGQDGGKEVHNTTQGKLFVDKTRNRIGVKGAGPGDGEVYVPLSDVLDLLKKGVL